MIPLLRTVVLVSTLLIQFAAFGSQDPLKSINGRLVPAATGDFVFVVAGDNRPTAQHAPLPRVLPTIFSEIRLIRPDFTLWTGDTIYGYGDSPNDLRAEYRSFLSRARRAAVPIFNAPGNHEIHGEKPCDDPDPVRQFKDHFGNVYGSFDYRGVHFIALDTEECGHVAKDDPWVQFVDGDQLDWLRHDLEVNKTARATFVFFHTEVTPAPNDEDADNHKPLGNAAELRALFKQYRVKAVFQGHEHLFYETSDDDVRYFVAGGAGAPLYARPEKGGFSHYLVIEMNGNTPTYSVVEPGHLYTEEGAAAKRSERLVWMVNSTDMPLPVRRIETSVPASLGTCAELAAESRLKKDGKDIAVSIEIAKCQTSGNQRKLTIVAKEDVPRRSSVPIYILKGTH